MRIKDRKPLDKVFSLSGDQIVRHSEPVADRGRSGSNFVDEISGHVERNLGPVAQVLHEIVSDEIHVDILVVNSIASFPFLRLVTSGMSGLPMNTPKDFQADRRAELMMTLPGDWRLDESAQSDERWYWPIRLLKLLARFPHKYDTWLGWGHTMRNGNPCQPYAPGCLLSSVMLLDPISAPDNFDTLRINKSHEIINFYALVPLYENETTLKLTKGIDELLARLEQHGVTDVVDPTRPSIV